jgi:cell division ATPase FtsA
LAATIKQVVDKQLEEVMKVLRNYDQRIETVLLSGGGSMLKGLAEYLQEHTDLDVQYGNYARLLAPGTPDEYYSPEYASLVGALILGSDYRQLHPNLNLQKDKKSLKERIKEYANNITDNTLNLVTINIDK